MCFSVTSTLVQSFATVSSFLSYCMRSLPVISSLHTLSAACAGAVNRNALTASSAAASNVERVSFIARLLGRYRSIGNAEPLVHDRARRRVLQELFLLRIQMVLDGE